MNTADTRWFGRLLDWRRNPEDDTHTAWHGRNTHRIVKLDKRSADAHRTTPGWHMWSEGDPWYGIGPFVGSTLRTAYINAEAWILCGYDDMMAYPALSQAVAGLEVYCGPGMLVRADVEARHFAVIRRSEQLAAVRPVFWGRGIGTAVRWEAHSADGRRLATTDTWTAAFDQLRAVLPPPAGAAVVEASSVG